MLRAGSCRGERDSSRNQRGWSPRTLEPRNVGPSSAARRAGQGGGSPCSPKGRGARSVFVRAWEGQRERGLIAARRVAMPKEHVVSVDPFKPLIQEPRTEIGRAGQQECR